MEGQPSVEKFESEVGVGRGLYSTVAAMDQLKGG
jgi:hypothetical protein